MKNTIKRIGVWVGWMLVSYAWAGTAPEEYEIKLTRPIPKGYQFQITSQGSIEQKQIITQPGSPKQEQAQKVQATLRAKGEVVECNADGNPIHIRYIIDEFTAQQNDNKIEIAKPGSELVVVASGTSKGYSLNGSGVSQEVAQLLLLLGGSYIETEGPKQDDVLGTKKKQKIGSEWPVQAELVAKRFAQDGLTIDPKNIKGKLKVEKKTSQNKIDCLSLAGKVEVKDIAIPPQQGSKVEKAQMTMVFSGNFPIDLTLPPQSESIDILNELVMRPDSNDPQAKGVKASLITHQTATVNYAPVESK